MKNLSILFRCLLLVGAVTFFASCGDDDDSPEPMTLTEIAADVDRFSSLVTALERTGLDVVLNGSGSFTVFAPNNSAFTAAGVDASTFDVDELKEILEYHVFVGQSLTVANIPETQVYLGTAGTNGPDGTSLSLLVEKSGSSVTVNGDVPVINADIEGSNGVIHEIGSVLLPLNIVGHAQANSNFTSLVGALAAADGDLVGTLSNENATFTVLAPVNQAFTDIQPTVDGLTTAQLASILTYHVIGDVNATSTLLQNQNYGTVNGAEITVNKSGDTVTITDETGATATVLLANVQATNGVIHVIDKVLLLN